MTTSRTSRGTSPELRQFYELMDNGVWDQILDFINGLEESIRANFFQAINETNTIRLCEMFGRHNHPLPEALSQKVAKPRNTTTMSEEPTTLGAENASEAERLAKEELAHLVPPAVAHQLKRKKSWVRNPFWWIMGAGAMAIIVFLAFTLMPEPKAAATTSSPGSSTQVGDASASTHLLADETVNKAVAALTEAKAEARRAVAAAEARAAAAEAMVIELQAKLGSHQEVEIPEGFEFPENPDKPGQKFGKLYVAP